MKKIIKNNLFGFILGIVLCSGIVYAASLYNARDISYNNSNSEAKNVHDAIDDLYQLTKQDLIPDTYFYDSNTSGKDIVRYKKVDGKYYFCDKNGNITDETEQDVSSLSLVEYTDASADSILSGTTGYVNHEFLLGSAKTSSSIKLLGSGYTGNQTIDFSTKLNNYSNLTAANFIIEIVGITGGGASGRLDKEYNTHYANVTATNISKSYDASTGKLTVSGANVYVTAGTDKNTKIVGTGYVYQKYNVYYVENIE